jgi:hypothetical protein
MPNGECGLQIGDLRFEISERPAGDGHLFIFISDFQLPIGDRAAFKNRKLETSKLKRHLTHRAEFRLGRGTSSGLRPPSPQSGEGRSPNEAERGRGDSVIFFGTNQTLRESAQILAVWV